MIRHQTIAALAPSNALATCAYGFLLHASAAMPYPDPTPELLRRQAQQQLRSAQSVALSAGFVAAACQLWLRWLRTHVE